MNIKMSKTILVLFCFTICLNQISAKHLVRRSNKDVNGEDCNEVSSDPTFKCPQPNGLFPHKECIKFWHCSNGYACEKTCPEMNPDEDGNTNLYYNEVIQVCDWPSNVPDSNCLKPDEEEIIEGNQTTTTQSPTTITGEPTTTEEPIITEVPTTTEPEITTAVEDITTQGTTAKDTTTTEQTTTDGTTTTEDPSNPNCNNGVYHRHPDCTKFWQCDNGVPKERDCAPGTVWDQANLTCNHPQNVPPIPNCSLQATTAAVFRVKN